MASVVPARASFLFALVIPLALLLSARGTHPMLVIRRERFSRTASIRALRYVPRGGSALSRSAISGIHRNIRARVSSALRKKSRCRNSYRFDTSSLTPRCASFCAPSRFAWRHLLPRMIASNSFSALRHRGQTVWPFGSNFAPHRTHTPCSRADSNGWQARRIRSMCLYFDIIKVSIPWASCRNGRSLFLFRRIRLLARRCRTSSVCSFRSTCGACNLSALVQGQKAAFSFPP